MVQVLRARIDVEQAGHDLARRHAFLDPLHCRDLVRGVVFLSELAQAEDGTVVLLHGGERARIVGGGDLLAAFDEVDAVQRLVVLAHVVVALGRARVVVEGHARADDVEEGRPLVRHRRLDQRHELVLVTREGAADEGGTHQDGERDEVDRLVRVGHALLADRALVGGGRELALGQAVDAVVHDDVGHVHAAAHDVGELAESDRGRIAVARHAHVDQVLVGEVGAGHHRRHAAVHGVEAVAGAQEVGRRLRRAADARELGDLVRQDVEFVARLDDGGADRVVAAAGAQRRDRALVVAPGVAGLVLDQRGMMQPGLGDVGHDAAFSKETTFSWPSSLAMPAEMKRAVIGVPS